MSLSPYNNNELQPFSSQYGLPNSPFASSVAGINPASKEMSPLFSNHPLQGTSSAGGDNFNAKDPLHSDLTKPDMTLHHFSDLTPEKVQSQGDVKAVAFDVDDTLSKFKLGKRSIPPELIKQLQTLQKSGGPNNTPLPMAIISNNPSSKATLKFQKELKDAGIDMPVIPHAEKPSTAGFKRLEKEFGLPANQMMMVGDSANTDILGGNRTGFKTAQVDWFNTSSAHKKMMAAGEVVLSKADQLEDITDTTPDQPDFFPALSQQPKPIAASA